MQWQGFWSSLVQVLGTIFAVAAVATAVIKEQRKYNDRAELRQAAAIAGLAELGVATFAALASLAPAAAWGISVVLPILIGAAGLASVMLHQRTYVCYLCKGGQLDTFDREQRWGSIITIAAYITVITTAQLTETTSDLYWLRAIAPCYLAISGTWEQVAYLGGFTSLFRPSSR